MPNPYQGTELEGGWAMGFAWGFVGPAFSQEPPSVLHPDLTEVFNEGVLAGQEAAISGLPIDPACVSLAQEVSTAAEKFMHGVHLFEGGSTGIALIGPHLAHAAVEAFVAAFLFMIPGPPPLSASEEFDSVGASVQSQLATLGLARGSLFVGAGIDENAGGCELLFTPVFKDLDATRSAVEAQARPRYVIAEWDTEMPMSGGGFRVVEAPSL